MHRFMGLIILLIITLVSGCSDFGQVDQGRVISYDKNTETIVILQDKSPDAKFPDYTALPPVSYKLPVDPNETGPDPMAGMLLNIDLDKKEAVILMENARLVETVNFNVVKQEKIAGAKDPRLLDPATKKMKAFPLIDPGARTIETYLESNSTLLTFSVPDKYFSLPANSWLMGDEVRIYYKQPGQALRYMNITKTDIFKK